MLHQILAFLLLIALTNSHVNSLYNEGIVGGYHPPSGTFKYIVTLNSNKMSRSGLRTTIQCMGVLISKQHVLTIASGVTKKYTHELVLMRWFIISMGTHDFKLNNAIKVEVEEVYVPKEYDPLTHVADFAVAKMKQDFNFIHFPQLDKIELPDDDTIDEFILPADVSGYGYYEYNFDLGTGKNDNELRYVRANVTGIDECKSLSPYPGDHLLCVKSLPERPGQPCGICRDDLGAPLVYNGKLIGLANSAQADCVDSINPALYTRIKPYVSLIRRIVAGTIPPGTRRWREPRLG